MSKHGKEAVEELRIDVDVNRKIHLVKEKDINGNWKTVHHEDEPLKKKQRIYGIYTVIQQSKLRAIFST